MAILKDSLNISLRTVLLAGLLFIVSSSGVLAHTDVTVEQARDLIDSNSDLIVVDVREEYEYCDARGHIPGALNYPWNSGVLGARYEELPMDSPIMVVCRSGGRSNMAANFLDSKGFSMVYDMMGGMNAWIWERAPCKYAGGSGTSKDPYQIATAEDLMLLGESPEDYDKHFIMIDDIDLDPDLPGRKVFERAVIAPDTNDIEPDFQGISFTGVFDGNGHIISNLTIEGGNHLGLFGQILSGSIISNLGIEAIDVNGIGYSVGGLAGRNWWGNIMRCHSSGILRGEESVGGLVGWNWSGKIEASSSTIIVSGCQDVGGLVGSNIGGDISLSYSNGGVSGEYVVGGLVGVNQRSFWTSILSSNINNCYSTCSVSGIELVGGLFGYNEGYDENGYNGPCVSKCYSTGAVSGNKDVGGLVGFNKSGIITASFWDIETSGQTTSDGGIGKTTAEMQTANTFFEAGWDFVGETTNGTEDIWWIDAGKDYPRLWWEPSSLEQSTDDLFFLVVDDFESYNDLEVSNEIWNIWIDGFDNPEINGSMIGESMPPFVGWSIAHTGKESMPYYYNNSGPANYSEATANAANLMAGNDWTKHGIKTLSLWFRRFHESDPWFGGRENEPEPMYVALANVNGPAKAVYHDDPNAAQVTTWTEWRIDLHDFTAQGVDLSNIDTISIGFGYKDNPQPGGSGKMHFDDIRLYRTTP